MFAYTVKPRSLGKKNNNDYLLYLLRVQATQISGVRFCGKNVFAVFASSLMRIKRAVPCSYTCVNGKKNSVLPSFKHPNVAATTVVI